MSKLSTIMDVDAIQLFELVNDGHYMEKQKTYNGYFTNEKIVVRKLGEYFFLDMLRNGRMQWVKEKLYDSSPGVRFLWKKLVMQLLRYKKVLKPILTPKPTQDQLRLIATEFKESNSKLERSFGLGIGGYGYPV
jgi:hypothetical protein